MPKTLPLTQDVLAKIAGAVVLNVEYAHDGNYVVIDFDDPASGEQFRLYADAPTLYPR